MVIDVQLKISLALPEKKCHSSPPTSKNFSSSQSVRKQFLWSQNEDLAEVQSSYTAPVTILTLDFGITNSSTASLEILLGRDTAATVDARFLRSHR